MHNLFVILARIEVSFSSRFENIPEHRCMDERSKHKSVRYMSVYQNFHTALNMSISIGSIVLSYVV